MQINENAIIRKFGNVTAMCNQYGHTVETYQALKRKKSNVFKRLDSKNYRLFKLLDSLGFILD